MFKDFFADLALAKANKKIADQIKAGTYHNPNEGYANLSKEEAARGWAEVNARLEAANKAKASSSSSGGGGGGGGSSTSAVNPLPVYTADDLAKRFGIVNDYATILKELQDATAMKFDETETTMKRAESSNLRGQETAYNQYLQDLRSRAANAVASGATKGTMAANSLSSMLGLQEANREPVNVMNELLYDTAQQRGSALAADVVTARNQANEIGEYLGQLSTSMDTNAINKYAAELAAQAQRYQASVGASAATNAARIQANSAHDQLLNTFKNNLMNQGYTSQQADALKYTSYVDYLDRQYPAK